VAKRSTTAKTDSGSDMGRLVLSAIVVGGGGAVILVLGWLTIMTVMGNVNGQPIVIATHDIEVGETLTPEHLALGTMLPPALPQTFSKISIVLGYTVKSKIYAGDPIHSERLGPRGHGPGLTSLVPSGKRAVWLPLKYGAEGLGIEPGDFIDVWASFATRRGEIQTLSAAELLEVAHVEPATTRTEGRVTLAATQKQLVTVTEYRTDAQIHFALRSDLETPSPPPGSDVRPHPEGEFREVHAARDLLPGMPIQKEDLILRVAVGPGRRGFTGTDAVVGTVPHSRVLAGERLLPERLADPAVGRGMAALIPPAHALVSVPVGDQLDAFQIGKWVTPMVAIPGRTPTRLSDDLQVLGHSTVGQVCPCVQLVAEANAVGHIVHAMSMDRLALSVPEED
jgi:Flp pilus assembly protein CpaB